MRMFLTILVCKTLRWAGKLLGKGSSMPGRIALKLCPDILQRVKLPEYVVAVTGSNGKTSTVEMMAHILQKNGHTVAYNQEGSNQIEGVTTFILDDCDMHGRVRSDLILLESDERFARHTFRHFTPTHYVITNLYRDQLTRNGHPEWVFDILRESISPKTKLILNADDPLVSCFGIGREEEVVWFGVDRLPQDMESCESIYDDGAFCPHCKARMTYEYIHYNHIGSYRCESCGHHKHETQFTVTEADLEQGYLVVNGADRISLALRSMYNVYNILAAYTVASLLGVPGADIARDIGNYMLKNGRVVTFTVGGHSGTLLASKHENSISYDQSIQLAVTNQGDCTVLIIVDAVSRKYFTSEVSWLWDIDFEKLRDGRVRSVVLAGRYCNDLAVRFDYTGVPAERITIIEDIGEAVEHLKEHTQGDLFVITCFSDKEKFLSKVEVIEQQD